MQTKKYISLILIIVVLSLASEKTFAEESNLKFSELRIFTLSNTFSTAPTALNNLTAVDNIDKLDAIYGFGLEADARYKWFKVGTRFKLVAMSKEPPKTATPSSSTLNVGQYALGVLARIPILDQDAFQFDIVTELGAANTRIDVNTTSGKGTFGKDAGPFGRIGASIGLGWPSFKLYVEGGQEFNNLTDLKYEGTQAAANNISSIDLSGTYLSAGIIISGIPSWIKPGNITFGK